jgi:hypothetical protein
VHQWDTEGKKLKRLADEHGHSCDDFTNQVLRLMGVQNA